MPAVRALRLYQANDDTIAVTIADDDTDDVLNLGSVTELTMVIKASRETADASATLLTLTDGDIVVTNASAGRCEITVPATAVPDAGELWYRLDVERGGTTRTAVFGDLHIIDL